MPHRGSKLCWVGSSACVGHPTISSLAGLLLPRTVWGVAGKCRTEREKKKTLSNWYSNQLTSIMKRKRMKMLTLSLSALSLPLGATTPLSRDNSSQWGHWRSLIARDCWIRNLNKRGSFLPAACRPHHPRGYLDITKLRNDEIVSTDS